SAVTGLIINSTPIVTAGSDQTICVSNSISLTAICNLYSLNATLSGSQQVPSVATSASGTLTGTFNSITNQIIVNINYNGLSNAVSGAHLHNAASGSNGSVIIDFLSAGFPTTIAGAYTYNATLASGQVANLLNGNIYSNIHTSTFPSGEVRGQITATCVANSYTWNPGNLSGQTVSVSPINTTAYTLTALNTTTGCSSTATVSVNVNPLPIPTIGSNSPICQTNTLMLNASGGTSYSWTGPNGFTSTDQNPSIPNATITVLGNYFVTVTNANGCSATASTNVILNTLNPTASNTGPYTVGQAIALNATGGTGYSWTGPNSFISIISNPTINNSLSVNAGTYTVTVTANGCTATATTNVIINGIDPCDPSRIVDYFYVKAGNPYQSLFPLTNGMVINQITEQVSILVTPSLCPNVMIESFEMNIQGPELNWNILQNAAPNALFDNTGPSFYGRNFIPGNYSLTVTGYAQDNKGGGITYGPVVTTFTVVGNLATISMPSITGTEFCAGNNVTVNFSTTGTFNGGNQFQAQLSNANGSFENPVIIGTTNIAGTVNATIPLNTPEGSNYLIRVASSNQALAGNPTISLLTINPLTRNLVSPTNDLTGNSTKKAANIINASNKVTSPANVIYQAGNAILLTPGFQSGSIFKAEIRGCEN
ncbi:CHRD domain-containing protein, partial [Emticicia sp.]|uniref:CHRD domain-containing protein n=1 Tax=Emticicia sp. TaxID=1930953 RepID=UPI00374FEB13